MAKAKFEETFSNVIKKGRKILKYLVHENITGQDHNTIIYKKMKTS